MVTAAGAAPVTVAVTLTVTAPAANLGLSWNALTFAAPGTTGAQAMILSTDGLPISFTATSGAKWLLLNTPVSGTPSNAVTGVVTSPATPVTLTVSLDPVALAALAPQTAPYVGKITIVASGPPVAVKSQTITVNLTVNSSPPTISSVWPTSLPLGSVVAAWVTVMGTNYYSATVVKVQGITGTLTPKLVSATELSVQIPASMLATPTTLNLIASNPAPGLDSTVTAKCAIAVASPIAIYTNGVVSAASYASDAVSPGELITIFGTNIGPALAAPMTTSNGYVATTLSGVSATVDGKNAPIVYASLNQITIQVPYEATTGVNKVVSVTNGNPPVTAKVTINLTAPGIFTADGSGTGQAAALNYDSTAGLYALNGSSTPVKIGDIVVLYLTGEGNYNAVLLTGAVLTNTGFIIPSTLNPLPQMSPLPAVTIGGVSASVSYAGPMVGGMLGLLQINVTVPTGSTTGAAVPISVTIGGVSTQTDQPNVTLSIHP